MFTLRPYKAKYELAVKVAGSMASEIIRIKTETVKLKAETGKLKAETGKLKEEIKVRESEIATLKKAIEDRDTKLRKISEVYGAE